MTLPKPLRHAVDQTVAAERLEGWRPTDEHLADLGRLATGELTFGRYLAAYRARYPPAAEPSRDLGRIFRRSRPYLMPGTSLLRNNFGANDPGILADLEFIATAGRLLQCHKSLAEGALGSDQLTARALHRQVFADVYSWAGEYRTTELRRGDVVFAGQSRVASEMAVIDGRAAVLAASGAALDSAAFGWQLARLYADYNQIHPFREGNGRAGTLLLHTIAARCGRWLDLSTVRRDEWYAASADSMPLRRDGRPSHRPFLPLMWRALPDRLARRQVGCAGSRRGH